MGARRAPTAVPSPAAFAASSPLIGDLCITPRHRAGVPQFTPNIKRNCRLKLSYAKVSVGRGGSRRRFAPARGRDSRLRGNDGYGGGNDGYGGGNDGYGLCKGSAGRSSGASLRGGAWGGAS